MYYYYMNMRLFYVQGNTVKKTFTVAEYGKWSKSSFAGTARSVAFQR